MPAFLAAAPLLGKAAMFAKGLAGMGAAKAGTSALVTGSMGKGLAARSAIGAATQGARKFAGNALASYMGPGGVTAGNIAANFAPDAVFGVMQGAMTPGDLGDKIIAGGSTAIGGALGGVGAVSALGKFGQSGGGRMLAEFGGGMLGDMGGQMVGDQVLRAKGGGLTPWEKVQQQGDQEYRQQLEREVLAAYGIGGYNQTDLLG